MTEAIIADYPSAHLRYDEMFSDPGKVRAHWQSMLAYLGASSSAQMQHRLNTLRKQVRENGVTYNVYGDPRGSDRPWELDLLPMILPANEWAQIEAAVIQRANLMNRILLDVYGDQKLLADGDLPASLVHGHAGFLRPCHGIAHLTGVALNLYAVDLARSPDGRWWALHDRTQAPSGAGYALENRMVISRAFPDLFRDLNVQRLAGFFAALRDSLAHWGRSCVPYQGRHLSEHERPLIVLLTPGPYNETYYEHAYQARYLGFPLVQGTDLTVRDGFVWLKSLNGLQRVHVIVRRLDDDFCDPLELRGDSRLGVAGLTEAARRGTVVIANSLGSNLLESGALLGFLPKLCELILGEKLKMPSVATWWCGEPAALDAAIMRFDKLVFKPSFPQLRQPAVFGADLTGQERQQFIDRLRADPQNFVAQESVNISQAPIWEGQHSISKLGASAVGLRVFACASPNGYVVMPGGLTRVASGPDARIFSMQRGGGSKDTWVMTEERVSQITLLQPATDNQDLLRGETHLASRTVENLFWFGRYSERSDNTARLMRRCFESLIETSPEYRGGEWPTLIALCQWQGLIEFEPDPKSATQSSANSATISQTQSNGHPDTEPGEARLTTPDDEAIERRLLQAMHDPDLPGLSYQVRQLFRVGFNVRERLSEDNWRSLNQMLQNLAESNASVTISDALALLDEAAVSFMTLSGFTLDGMTRDMGWRFLSMGRRIERLQFMCSVIQHALAMPSNSGLEWLLELGDSIVTYRARYVARPEWLAALDLLLLDESNPRAVVFQLEGLIGYLNRVSKLHGPCGQDLLEPLLAQLRALNPARDLRPGSEVLLALMRNLYSASYRLSEQLASRFFSYAGRIDARVFKS